MTSSAQVRVSENLSVRVTTIIGQIPIADRQSVRAAHGIRMPVRGKAIRFVSRKYLGKVPKYMYARGPVVS